MERKIIQGFYVSTGFVGTRKPESFSEERVSFPHLEVIEDVFLKALFASQTFTGWLLEADECRPPKEPGVL